MTELERLTKHIESAMYWGADTPEKIAERLIDEGVICPPCKVGDTVYYLGGIYSRAVKTATIVEIIVNFCGVSELLVTDENNVTFEDSIDIFYLTREEAEAALAEKQSLKNKKRAIMLSSI